jgi:hypothetical protein
VLVAVVLLLDGRAGVSILLMHADAKSASIFLPETPSYADKQHLAHHEQLVPGTW